MAVFHNWRIDMNYYVIEEGTKVEIQVYTKEYDLIDVYDSEVPFRKIFNETWLESEFNCDCCNEKKLVICMGENKMDNIVTNMFLVVSENDVTIANGRSALSA